MQLQTLPFPNKTNIEQLNKDVDAYLEFYSVIYPIPMLSEYIAFDKHNQMIERISAWTQ